MEIQKIPSSLKQKYAEFAERNKNTVGMNEVVLSCLVLRVFTTTPKEKEQQQKNTKDNKDRKYFIIKACTLNRKDVKMTMDNNETSQLKQHSCIYIAFYDRVSVVKLKPPCICTVYLRANWYDNRVSYKASKIIQDQNQCLDMQFYNRFIRGGPMSEVPTADNINPEDFGEATKQKYMSREFFLPLSSDTDRWSSVFPILNLNDSRRFFGKMKDTDEIVPSVTMETGSDKVTNNMNVMFGERRGGDGGPEVNYIVKFAYFPNVWSCFGISNVEHWSKCAGTMIAAAKGWFALGSANREDISRLCSNAEVDNGYEIHNDDDEVSELKKEEDDIRIIGSNAWISDMNIDLIATIKNCGIVLPNDWVLKTYGNNVSTTENPLNINCHVRIKTPTPGTTVYNITEMASVKTFVEDAGSKAVYYGIVPTGTEIKSFSEAMVPPTTVFAVVTF